ncbi:energy transducer TonB [Sphingomonas sabuli]|uniref:Energy transducer TonB n=1 Tax=Sphingomonas sabuli TaxID=2764186 RepID=A0A7G9L0I9_9SPHN|nr:energy transducer TonB [Sphingomonas sabuli]QNM82138.1 energy transducer TonB [Sphingomonas sabuli]
MSVYAPVPAFADRARHPRALVIIVGAHAALLAAVISARMDMPVPWAPTATTVTLVPEDPVPPENPPPERPKSATPAKETVRPVDPVVPTPPLNPPSLDPTPLPPIDPGASIGSGNSVTPGLPADPVRVGPRFATPESRVRPPYPAQKISSEEEAALRLRLSIDAQGRVTAVDGVGANDPVFLVAARRHIIANWRYRPATENGKPVASSTVITLRFELD